MIHAFAFLKHPEQAGRKPIYVAAGDDAWLRRQSTQAVAKLALGPDVDDLAVTRFAGDQAKLADVMDELRTLPFLAPTRVVFVEDADPFVTAHRKELEAYAERPASTGVLVLTVKAWPANTKLAKAVEKTGLAIECKTPAERELPAWLTGLAQHRYGLKLDDDAARLLVELVGAEVGLLAAELDKLAIYVGTKKAIRREDVTKMVGAGRVETIWRILDAATTGRGPEALEDLDRLMAAGEHPVGLLAAMGTSLRKLHRAGQLRRKKLDAREACRIAGIPPFAVETTLKQHTHLGPTRVAALPRMLLKADLDLKGSLMLDPRTVLERLLVELSRPRRD